MDINNFIEKIAIQFDEVDVVNLNAGTKFRDIEGWSSFLALSVIAMADAEYGVKIRGEDIRNSQTIEDLFKIIKARI